MLGQRDEAGGHEPKKRGRKGEERRERQGKFGSHLSLHILDGGPRPDRGALVLVYVARVAGSLGNLL